MKNRQPILGVLEGKTESSSSISGSILPRCAIRIACLVGILGLCAAGAANAELIVYTSIDVPKIIPDDDDGGITSELVVPDSFVIDDLDLILDELLHESVSDLRIELTSPFGTTVVLIESASEGGILGGLGTSDNFIGTILDDQAPTSLRDAFFDNHVGTYNIDDPSVRNSPLSAFNGENARGTWVLRISDRARFDTGVLNAWGLRFTTRAVPEPASLAMLGTGLAAAFRFGRKKPRA